MRMESRYVGGTTIFKISLNFQLSMVLTTKSPLSNSDSLNILFINGLVPFLRGSSPRVFKRKTVRQSSSDFCISIQVVRLPSGIGPDLASSWCSSSEDVAASIGGYGTGSSRDKDSKVRSGLDRSRLMASRLTGMSSRNRSIAQSFAWQVMSDIRLKWSGTI